MANIFKANKDVNNHPNRNNFDLSYQSHLTMKYGYLYPVFCRRVVPGDSFKINTAFGLKFMPMVFPVQSRMRAHMHYFYVRKKNLWKEYENWVSGLVTDAEHPHPYIQVPDTDFKNGSIHDFLGVPTSAVVNNISSLFSPFYVDGNLARFNYSGSWIDSVTGYPTVVRDSDFTSSDRRFIILSFNGDYSSLIFPLSSPDVIVKAPLLRFLKQLFAVSASSLRVYLYFFTIDGNDVTDVTKYKALISSTVESDLDSDADFSLLSADFATLNSTISSGVPVYCGLGLLPATTSLEAVLPASGSDAVFEYQAVPGYVDYSSLGLNLYQNGVHLDALPYRAYESIYRAYYANSVLQPLRDENDKPLYNQYIPEDGDGADTTPYALHQRNYELDAYTSCQPSPQQGVAPLVGMSALGNITVVDENGLTTASAEIDNDGTITKIALTSPAASVDHARTLMNIASSGMSINDFRATNALQRMLETTLRKGYRYMDFIAGHFGKEPEYRELDMPEFIGGFSRDVSVTTTFSSADTYDSGTGSGAQLGDYVGNASCFGGSQHSVSHYCDDFGYIIGILCVTPTPAYSQILQKQMVCPSNYLDEFFPEFNQLGLQPITYEEMTPIQRYIEHRIDSSKKLQDTFGYQRPYHDYVSAIDEVHGEFRGSMHDYLVNRIFAQSPELGDEFLRVKPEEVNDIFVNTTPEDDTIIGQIVFDVKAKRPINRIVIPGLGR